MRTSLRHSWLLAIATPLALACGSSSGGSSDIGDPTNQTGGQGGAETGGAETGGATGGDAGGAETGGSGGINLGGDVQRRDVTGQLKVGDTMYADGDVNDPTRYDGAVDNDASGQAQLIGNPAVVVGYLGEIADEVDFPDDFKVDSDDWYAVDLRAGQSVTLYIGQPATGAGPDMDLTVYEDDGTTIAEDSSTPGDSAIEGVTITEAGRYLVRVYGAGDAADYQGGYTLTVGSYTPASVSSYVSKHRRSKTWAMADDAVLVKLAPGKKAKDAADVATDAGVSMRPIGGGWSLAQLPSTKSAKSAAERREQLWSYLRELARHPDVAYAEPDTIVQAHAVPNDPLYKSQWHYPMINLPEALDEATGDGVVVAVVDTGIVSAHADLAGQLTSDGYDMIDSLSVAADGDGRDDDPEDPGDGSTPSDHSWHGTHCAGTIAAATDNGIGVAGVAPDAKVMPVRVLGRGGGRTSDVVAGIRYAAGVDNDSGELPSQKADIISMSLGGPGRNAAMQEAVDAARAAGVIVIASAGNDSSDAGFYSPAGEDGVVTVSAIDPAKGLAFYSNFGDVVEVGAPGGDTSRDSDGDGFFDGVLSTIRGTSGPTGYSPYQGTSMAAPHVAGVAALMKEAWPGMGPADFDQLLAGTYPDVDQKIVEDLGASGRDDQFGFGMINAALGVAAAQAAKALEDSDPAPTPVPLLGVSTRSMDFAAIIDELELTISNVGEGTLDVTAVTDDADWLTVEPGDLGDNTVTVDRDGLADGLYDATITVESDGGTAEVAVRMRVGSEISGGDIGTVYVLLWDPTRYDPDFPAAATIAQVVTTADDDYSFELLGVPEGVYSLFAGTDTDNDGLIDDDGEVFGGYPVMSDPVSLDLTDADASFEDLVFTAQPMYDLAAASADGSAGRTPFLARKP